MTQPDPLSILAWLPDLSDCTRLVDAFLAGRRPTTLAACRADLEDFRCYTGTSTVAYAAKWLLDSPQDFAKLLVSLYQLEMSKRGLQATTINRRLAKQYENSNQ